MYWRGLPLANLEAIINSVAATTTRTSLTVHAELDIDTYATGTQISDAQVDALPLNQHD